MLLSNGPEIKKKVTHIMHAASTFPISPLVSVVKNPVNSSFEVLLPVWIPMGKIDRTETMQPQQSAIKNGGCDTRTEKRQHRMLAALRSSKFSVLRKESLPNCDFLA